MSVEARVDADVCIGSGDCVRIAPDAFQIGEQGVSRPQPGMSKTQTEVLLRAARECPINAIKVVDGDAVLYESA